MGNAVSPSSNMSQCVKFCVNFVRGIILLIGLILREKLV
jgi:hypothetical protein